MKAAREILDPRTVAALVETSYFGGEVARSIHRGTMAEAAVCEWREREGIADEETFRKRFAEVFPLAVAGTPPFQYLGFGAELLEAPSIRHAVIDTYKDALAGRVGPRDPKATLREIGETLSMRGAALRKAQRAAADRDERRSETVDLVADFLKRIDGAIPKKCTDGKEAVSALSGSLREEVADFQFSPWDFSAHVNVYAPLWVGRVLHARRSTRRGGTIAWKEIAAKLLHDLSDAQQEGDLDQLRERLKKTPRGKSGGKG